MNKFLTNSGIRSFHLARNISGIEFACTLEIYFASLEITRSTMPIAGVHRFVVADIVEKLWLKQQ